MNEDEIEYLVERKIDQLDSQYMRGIFSDSEYRSHMREINEWADQKYKTFLRRDRIIPEPILPSNLID
jgi:hypothetical protein